MDKEAWCFAVNVVTNIRIVLSDWTDWLSFLNLFFGVIFDSCIYLFFPIWWSSFVTYLCLSSFKYNLLLSCVEWLANKVLRITNSSLACIIIPYLSYSALINDFFQSLSTLTYLQLLVRLTSIWQFFLNFSSFLSYGMAIFFISSHSLITSSVLLFSVFYYTILHTVFPWFLFSSILPV